MYWRKLKKLKKKSCLIGDSAKLITHKDVDINIFIALLIILSGLVMILIANFIFKEESLFHLCLMELIIIALNALLVGWYFKVRNYFAIRKAGKEQQTGFFFAPVYKNFISDLHGAQTVFRDKTEMISPSSLRLKDGKPVLEEGIDKYKPKHSYEILTASKLFTSQLVVVVAYIQLLAVIGFIYLFNWMQERRMLIQTVPVLLFYRVVMYLFAKTLGMISTQSNLDLVLHAYYVNTTFATIFYRIILLQTTDFRYVWIMLTCKGLYKIIAYLIIGSKITFWKHQLIETIRSKFVKKNEEEEKFESIIKSSHRPSFREGDRMDTISKKRMTDIKNEEQEKNKKFQKVINLLVSTFLTISTNDIFYSIASLCLIFGYKKFKSKPLSQ